MNNILTFIQKEKVYEHLDINIKKILDEYKKTFYHKDVPHHLISDTIDEIYKEYRNEDI